MFGSLGIHLFGNDTSPPPYFNQPLTERVQPELYTGQVPRVRVPCNTEQKVKLFELLDASNRLGVHLASEVTPQFGSGLFSVVKDLQRDRLILDSRGANTLEVPILGWVRGLAAGECLTRLTLQPSERLVCSGNDLKRLLLPFHCNESTVEKERAFRIHPCGSDSPFACSEGGAPSPETSLLFPFYTGYGRFPGCRDCSNLPLGFSSTNRRDFSQRLHLHESAFTSVPDYVWHNHRWLCLSEQNPIWPRHQAMKNFGPLVI